MKEIYITESIGQTRMAGLNESGDLVYLHIERDNQKSIVGQISYARVVEINKTQGIAYLELGNGRAILNSIGKLSEGDSILVQVTRDGYAGKLPAVHRRIAFENRYFTISSTGKGVQFVKSIGNGKTKAQMEKNIYTTLGEVRGLMVKSAARALEKADIKYHYKKVSDMLSETVASADALQSPCIVKPAMSMAERAIIMADDIAGIVTDTAHIYTNLEKCIENVADVEVRHFTQGNLFEQAGLNDAIEYALCREVALEGGGGIVIDETEALCAIDVNMGDTLGLQKGEDALFRLNKRAAKQIAKQIVLRNLSGLIVVDFVSMSNRGMQSQLPKILASALRQYDADGVWDVMDFTKAGLVEITRKRTRPPLSEVIQTKLYDRPLNLAMRGLDILQQVLSLRGAGVPTVRTQRKIITALQTGTLQPYRKDIESRIAKDIVFEESDQTSVELQSR